MNIIFPGDIIPAVYQPRSISGFFLKSGGKKENEGTTGEKTAPSFKIVRGAPEGTSVAKEIAEKYGVSYGLLVQKLKGRGLL